MTTTIVKDVTYTAGAQRRDQHGRFTNHRLIAVQTRRGHWYRADDERDPASNDTMCRGCNGTGHFDYILDNVNGQCPSPADAATIGALVGVGSREG
jgi:hypothetical protein